ncbi:MAG TPA: signal peptidase II [bacterium]|nr:signal peptidase II [bacterium]
MRAGNRLFWGAVLAGLVLDQFSKLAVLAWLGPEKNLRLFRYFSLTCVQNKGICFGWFGSGEALIPVMIVSAGFITGIAFYAHARKNLSRLEQTSLGIITAGITGNLIDRLRLGAVVDFLNFHVWPVFNLADTMIVTGVGLFILWQVKGNCVTHLSENR